MSVIPTVSPKNAAGIIDKVIGLGKEVVGEVLDNENLVQAGEAQQTKGTERLKALRAEAKADKHEAKAEASEKREKAAKNAK